MNPQSRRRFDAEVERVLAEMPPVIHDLLEKVPLHVEDHPSEEVMDDRGVEYLDELCGLYTGIPLGERSIMHSGTLPDVVTIYREGILSAACDARDGSAPRELRRQIRITILHELGHHHGLTEADLRAWATAERPVSDLVRPSRSMATAWRKERAPAHRMDRMGSGCPEARGHLTADLGAPGSARGVRPGRRWRHETRGRRGEAPSGVPSGSGIAGTGNSGALADPGCVERPGWVLGPARVGPDRYGVA